MYPHRCAIALCVMSLSIVTRSAAVDFVCVAEKHHGEVVDQHYTEYHVGFAKNGQPAYHELSNLLPRIWESSTSTDIGIGNLCKFEIFLPREAPQWTARLGKADRTPGYPGMLNDLGGDGLFDSIIFDRLTFVRWGQDLIKVMNQRGLPDTSTSTQAPDARIAFELQDGRWAKRSRLLLENKIAGDFTEPKIGTLAFPVTARGRRSDEDAAKKLDAVKWRKIRVAEMTFESASWPSKVFVDESGTTEVHMGNKITFSIRDDFQTSKWTLNGECEQRFSYAKSGKLEASALRVGNFEYFDADGNGTFDSFRNVEADEWVLITESTLICVGKPRHSSEFPKEFELRESDVNRTYKLVAGRWICGS
jgi:hypothetical protein